MVVNTKAGTEDSGQSTVTETTSPEETAALKALEDDTTSWDDGEEVESRFEAKDEDDSAATDEDESDDEESDEDVESEEDDDADSEEDDESTEDENDQESDDSDAADKEDTTEMSAEERKKFNDEMAQARINERKATQEAARLRKERDDATITQYLEDAGDDANERARRENNVEQFRLQEERTVFNDDYLRTGIDRAVSSISLFRTGSDAVKEELMSALDDFEAKFVVKDKSGRPSEIKIDPATGKKADVVTHLKRKAESIKRLQGEGATQQVKSKKKEKVRTIAQPVRAPKTAKTDPDLDAFDEEARK